MFVCSFPFRRWCFFLFVLFICQNWKRNSIKSSAHLLCAASLTLRKTLKCSRYICDVCPISGTSTGPTKLVPLNECSTSPISGQNGQNCWLKIIWVCIQQNNTPCALVKTRKMIHLTLKIYILKVVKRDFKLGYW